MLKNYLRTGIFSFLFFFLLTAHGFTAKGSDIPCIIKGNDGLISLHLPDRMAATLNKFNPDFAGWQMTDYPGWFSALYEYDRMYAPFAVIGDFNGDGILDVALEGRNEESGRTLVLLSNKGSFQVIIVRDGSPKPFALSPDLALSKAPPGLYLSPVDDETLELEKDGFGMVVVGKGISSVYYYDKGDFKSFLTGD